MPNTITWKREGGITAGGDVGGDEQAGECYTARYLSREVPDGVIDVHCYVLGPCEDTPLQPWAIRWAATYTLCTDTGRPGDTETWSEVIYRRHQWTVPASSENETNAAALRALRTLEASWLTWEGAPDVRELFPTY